MPDFCNLINLNLSLNNVTRFSQKCLPDSLMEMCPRFPLRNVAPCFTMEEISHFNLN